MLRLTLCLLCVETRLGLELLKTCLAEAQISFVSSNDFGFQEIDEVLNHVWHARPTLITLPKDTRETARVVSCASATNMTLTPRSGGYGLGGYSAGMNNGLVINLSHLQYLEIGDNSVALGAGITMADVLPALWRRGYTIAGGWVGGQSVIGQALGGGVSMTSRILGTLSDNLIEAEVVTPDGGIRYASDFDDGLLYYVLRGGGGGNFGFVTRAVFRVTPVLVMKHKTALMPRHDWPLLLKPFLQCYANWTANLPETVTSSLEFTADGMRIDAILMSAVSDTANADSVVTQLSVCYPPFLLAASHTLTQNDYAAWDHLMEAAEAKLGGFINNHIYAASVFLPDWNRLIDLALNLKGDAKRIVSVDVLGGAVAENWGGLFAHRSAVAHVVIWYVSKTKLQRSELEWVVHSRAVLDPRGILGASINYRDPNLKRPTFQYYLGDRNIDDDTLSLLKVATLKYDPERRLDFPLSVHKLVNKGW
eukprot:Blabericola_migrator_1__13460@NODE_970_length_5866_cov_22_974478_g672_i0_p2_GENE_NODE_970_length_5866_cov_22_974478_g672_i0NODE_970_length_5866_cov_22_974478_g672_i0_p2_ORF_typecomplete_len479_score99_76FAD_binding_4/PF01565_23/2_6e24FAD_binding_4/PF01565_23/3_2e02FAD_binding_5/PF00941_21/0_067_NODE_970_length_5866_cov_22_974478_g672_i043755811